jgi:hypothetical protein
MKGTPEEETGKGALDKYQTLRDLHDLHKPGLYLEIGVQKGRSLGLARCRAVGIDPFPKTKARGNQEIYAMTSDEFFDSVDMAPPDLAFIDGLHLFEQALKDFIHVERISHERTIVVMDDVFPAHPAQALRDRRTSKWAGDVWKVYEILKEYRPDLSIEPLDVNPTGMIVVTSVDSKNATLESHYSDIVEKYMHLPVPENILQRKYLR